MVATTEAYAESERRIETLTAQYLGFIWRIEVSDQPCEKLTGNVTLDPDKVARRMAACGKTLKALQDRFKAGNWTVGWRSVRTALEGKQCRASTACFIARALFG